MKSTTSAFASEEPVVTILFVTENALLHRELQSWCLDQGWNSLHCTHPSRALSTAQGQRVDVLVGEAKGSALDALNLGRRLRVRHPGLKLVLHPTREELKTMDAKAFWMSGFDFNAISGSLQQVLQDVEDGNEADPAEVAELKERLGEQEESIVLLETQLKKAQDEIRRMRGAMGSSEPVDSEDLAEREAYVRQSEEHLSERALDLTQREEELAVREDNVKELEQRLRDLATRYFSEAASVEFQDQLSNLVQFEPSARNVS
ncbi:MAG: hypothetical protein E1N59_1178 [Puniceicoccaceae bacterium 5H]|nr:MAG: hypothetical protein E1N59_1178 [Puniceicoccaceae bacterium 5H]